MKIVIGDQSEKQLELKKLKLENAVELTKMCIYIIARKFWRAQMIVFVLLGFASIGLLSTLFYYDAIRDELQRHRNGIVQDVKISKYFSRKTVGNPQNIEVNMGKYSRKKKYPRYYDEHNLHSEWTFQISRTYPQSDLHEWTEPHFPVENNASINLNGENGTSFVAPQHLKLLMQTLQEQHKYNLLASQMVSVNRSLPDLRFPECHSLSYPEMLPTTSVIIIFHNEEWVTLMRTVWSIINRSPRQLIKEIILVDDSSTDSSLKKPLEDYVEKLPVRMKVLRNRRREGLIRSRLLGANVATVGKFIFNLMEGKN